VEVAVPTAEELRGPADESSLAVATRVAAAREVQERRLAGRPLACNAALEPAELRRWCELGPSAQRLLDTAFERLGLSARAVARVLKVARTVADLAGAERIDAAHLAESLQFRCLDRASPAEVHARHGILRTEIRA
jgi:magnesium chelatase family protein